MVFSQIPGTDLVFAGRIIGKPGDKISIQSKKVLRNGQVIGSKTAKNNDTRIFDISFSNRDNLNETTMNKDEYFIYGALSGPDIYRSQIFRYNYNYNSDFIMFDNSGMTITHLLQGSASSNSNLYGAFTNTDLSCVIFSTPKNVAVENSYSVLRTFPSPSTLRCLTVQDGILYGVIAEAQTPTANSKLFKINVDGTGYT